MRSDEKAECAAYYWGFDRNPFCLLQATFNVIQAHIALIHGSPLRLLVVPDPGFSESVFIQKLLFMSATSPGVDLWRSGGHNPCDHEGKRATLHRDEDQDFEKDKEDLKYTSRAHQSLLFSTFIPHYLYTFFTRIFYQDVSSTFGKTELMRK